MVRRLTIREAASELRVHPSTTFRWRHRLLEAAGGRPLPALTGSVGTAEVYVRYSEKGSRKTSGTGAWGIRRRPELRRAARPRFRRYADGKPSCVLLIADTMRHRSVILGQGRPTADVLRAAMAPVVPPGCEVWTRDPGPYGGACLSLRIVHRAEWHPEGSGTGRSLNLAAGRLRRGLYAWLPPLRGIATRYLSHYLTWFNFEVRNRGQHLLAAGHRLLAETGVQMRRATVPGR